MAVIPFEPTLTHIPADAGPLTIPVGLTRRDQMAYLDLADAPHVLFAGATGSGKSVGLNVAIATILSRSPGVEWVMIDPKRVELAPYIDARGVRAVITEMDDAADALDELIEEMDERYRLFSQTGAKKLSTYNEGADEPMNEIILVVDELSDLMDTHMKVALPGLVRLAQLGRAAGIHMMLATQRPAADTIPKKLLGNIPTRIAYRTQSHTESRLIVNERGAEDLNGRGDLLALLPGVSGLTRAQCPFISDDEVRDIVQANLEPEPDEWAVEVNEVATEAAPEPVEPTPEPVDEPVDPGMDAAAVIAQVTGQFQREISGLFEKVMESERIRVGLEDRVAQLTDQVSDQTSRIMELTDELDNERRLKEIAENKAATAKAPPPPPEPKEPEPKPRTAEDDFVHPGVAAIIILATIPVLLAFGAGPGLAVALFGLFMGRIHQRNALKREHEERIKQWHEKHGRTTRSSSGRRASPGFWG